ncbi:MAG: cytochrome c family protein [Pseudomonadota bacterium]
MFGVGRHLAALPVSLVAGCLMFAGALSASAACDMERAEKVQQQCQVCHTLEEGAPHTTGPNLYGIWNRPAAAIEGFAYSPVLRKSGLVWDEETLDQFLAAPQDMLPYNRMAFGGVTNEADRNAIVCLLKSLQ